MVSHTDVTSFIVRFTRESWAGDDGAPCQRWRGLVKHVQSDEEQPFTRLADALRFMARYVDLDESAHKLSLEEE